jgi:hypothetical protein
MINHKKLNTATLKRYNSGRYCVHKIIFIAIVISRKFQLKENPTIVDSTVCYSQIVKSFLLIDLSIVITFDNHIYYLYLFQHL